MKTTTVYEYICYPQKNHTVFGDLANVLKLKSLHWFCIFLFRPIVGRITHKLRKLYELLGIRLGYVTLEFVRVGVKDPLG